MEKFKEEKGHVQIVEDHMVGSLSLCGYTLVGMYQEEHGDTVSCDEPDPKADYSGCTLNVRRPVQETRTRFIMREDEESTIGSLNSQVKRLREECDAAKKETEASAEMLKGTEARHKELDNKYNDLFGVNKRQRETIDQLAQTKAKMEEDIGKIRQAIGTVKMAEILAVEE